MRTSWCTCGHPIDWHQHYRDPTDCSCGYCRYYVPDTPWRRFWQRLTGRTNLT